jgi:hypothetical protein
MDTVAGTLFEARKKRKKPADYYKPSDFSQLAETGCYPLHSAATPGIN